MVAPDASQREEQAARDRKRSSRVVTVRDVFDDVLEGHRTKLDHKTILGYEDMQRVFPQSFLDEPAKDVTPAMLRKLISDRTRAPVMQNRHLSRLKAAVRLARSESYGLENAPRGASDSSPCHQSRPGS